jgi:hypothetical protein
MKYQLEYLADTRRVVMHVDVALTAWSDGRTRGIHVPDEHQTDAKLSDALLNVRGVAYVQIHPYEIEISLGRLFGWDHVLPEVIETIREVVAPWESIEEVTPRIQPRAREFVCPHCGFHKTV